MLDTVLVELTLWKFRNMSPSSSAQFLSYSLQTARKTNLHILQPSFPEAKHSARFRWRKPFGELRDCRPWWENMSVHGAHTRTSGVLSRILLGIVRRGPLPGLPNSFLTHRLQLGRVGRSGVHSNFKLTRDPNLVKARLCLLRGLSQHF